MSIKEGKCNIHEEELSKKLLIDVMANNTVLSSRIDEITKNDIQVLSDKTFDANIIKNIALKKSNRISSEHVGEFSFNCSVCHNVCRSCKSICVTCKYPCSRCFQKVCKNSSTDTDDFDKYLESLVCKVKIQPKFKTIGTDTCDLDGHFDYYNVEKKIIRIQKNVATDCADLAARKPIVKKPARHSVAVDTSDLAFSFSKKKDNEDSDSEYFWDEKEENSFNQNSLVEQNIAKKKKQDGNCESESLFTISGSSECFQYLKNEESNKKNDNIANYCETVFDGFCTSDDSDVDLATSSKLFKCKQLIKMHKIKLKKITKNKEVFFKCSICSETFQKKHLSLLHLGSHIENNHFKCLHCNSSYILLDLLCNHIKESHSNVTDLEKSRLESENKENSEADFIKQKTNKVFKCMLCPVEDGSAIQFTSSKALNLHQKEKHDIEKTRRSDKEVNSVKQKRIKKEFICLICGKQFKSSKALKDHSPVHTGEKNYHCDICSKSYTTSANLKIHKRTHTGAKDFVCTVCNKAFHKKDSLKVHFRKHSGERPFQCDLCPMKFDRNYILKNHRYTHFSEKKFICPVCGKTFTTHGGLKNHEKSHKKDPCTKKPRKPAVKPTLNTENAVICDVCGKIYSTKNNLRIHKFVHLGVKPFECTICHQRYAKKDSMLIHMRKHTDERPFACETCGMKFFRNHTLKTHLLRHTGERPHKCKICGKSFTQSSSLAYHIKNHDKKEKKKDISGECAEQKKKRLNQDGSKMGSTKKLSRVAKPEFQPQNVKLLYETKKLIEGSSDIQKEIIVSNILERNDIKGSQFTLPVHDKEVLILDKSAGVEFSRNPVRELDFFGIERDAALGSQYNSGKVNYYIAKSHVISFPKEARNKIYKHTEISQDKVNEDVENLIISKNSYITKEGNLVTLNREASLKDVKEEFVDVEDLKLEGKQSAGLLTKEGSIVRLDREQSAKEIKEEFLHLNDQKLELKQQTAIPISGEILNSAFVSDENGDVIPLGSMTLQSFNSENIMISPFTPIEGDDRKGLFRNSKLAVFDSKITYNIAGARLHHDRNIVKSNILHAKNSKAVHKVQIEVEPPSLHIQTPVTDDRTLNGISGFCNVQSTEVYFKNDHKQQIH